MNAIRTLWSSFANLAASINGLAATINGVNARVQEAIDHNPAPQLPHAEVIDHANSTSRRKSKVTS